MSIQKKIFAVLVGGIAFVGALGSAQAGVGCSNATIVGAGVFPVQTTSSDYRIRLICNDPTPPWDGARSFYLTTEVAESGYATALTAMSLGNPVTVWLASPVANSLCHNIYMIPSTI